ncbi:hypothetical protein L226DRAFT_386799 [Lentinus tigrinus ALCF2SS1-7]|uniref:BTB domain-containing protein n=1 Tax=Lentinus tigrinus ALCF2SS1-6 TaxID=1328759 RepID=A0A5C2S9W4_9APHY|nr:hypothetical protein L227DRAFT_88267 [Lentinus tigrinus ALCF2SS1-6]RPD75733.1 hypothetical protein L226DRAFT_386799 [Lentinus tigrinus ALCF2SS1-7]
MLRASTTFHPLSTHAKSQGLWYPDGNIVIKVDNTYYKLLASRLALYCGYFEKVLQNGAEDAAGASRSGETVDGCPVVNVTDITASEFETFASYLEKPLDHPVANAKMKTILVILRVSDVLSCPSLHDLAKARLRSLWWSSPIPRRKDNIDILLRMSDQHTLDAAMAIFLARRYKIDHVLKRAFYDILCKVSDWDNAESRTRLRLPLSDADIIILFQARSALLRRWRELLMTPPNGNEPEPACIACATVREYGEAERPWRREVADKFGPREPNDFFWEIENVVLPWIEQLRTEGRWCHSCLDDRQHAWEDVRELWWQQLDELFETGESA